MRQLFTNSGVKSFVFISKFFTLFFAGSFIFLFAGAQNYTPNTFSDPVITSVNNATGEINGGSTISLRSALMAADNLGGTHTVTLSTGTYLLDGSGTYSVPSQGTFSSRTIFMGNTAQDITINGNGAGNTIISMATSQRDRIMAINYDGTTPDVFTKINGVKFTNGYLNFDFFGGAAIYAGPYGGNAETLTLNGCAFDNNICPHAGGGAGGLGGAIYMFQGTLNIDSCAFTNNKSVDGDGGAIIYFLYNIGDNGVLNISRSTFNGNHSGTNGGAISFVTQGGVPPGQTFTAEIKKNTFLNNTADGYGGAIAANNSAAVSTSDINYNRFVGNTSSASSATSGLVFVNSDGDVNAENNWWGCNTGPTAAGACDKAGSTGSGSGNLIAGKWLQLKVSASPSSICASPGSTSTITASFLSNSANEPIAAADLYALIGLPVTWGPTTLGSLSGQQATIQTSGNATALFTSNGTSGNATVNAQVDNVPNNETAPSRANITVTGPVVGAPTVVQPTCSMPTGTITVNATGTGTLEYALNAGPYQTSNVFSGLLPGNYNITVRSQSDPGCVVAYSGNPVVISPATGCCVAPTITCPGNQAVNNAPESCGANVSYSSSTTGTSPTVTYSFSGATTGSGSGNGSGSMFNVGVTTVTLTATNACGTASCTFTVTVTDNEPPSITCPGDLTVQCASAVPAPNTASVTASDNCPGVTVTWVSDAVTAGDCPNHFTIARTYKATDAHNNSTTCVQTITVNDNTAPTITCPAPVTVQCASAIPAHDFAGGSASDNCGVANVTWVSDVVSDSTCSNRYTITRTYRATDDCGNSSTCTQTITVNDNTAPVINCPAAVTVQCASAVPAHDFAGGSASDNCGAVTVTWLGDNISGYTCVNHYTITRTYQATDACGNTSSCTQTITVNDNTAPVINCPASVTVQCASAVPDHDFAGGSASDNCGAVTVTWLGDNISGYTCVNHYTITRTYQATDACGNTSTCTQTITVNDNTPPLITCPGAVTVQCAGAVPSHDFAGGSASDNCGSVTVTWVSDVVSDSTCPNKFKITRTYRASDACGNSATCTQTITVNDNVNPTIVCPASQTVSPTSLAGAVVTYTTPVGTDNCGGATTTRTAGLASGSTFPIGTTTVTYQVTDACGNTASCSFTVTVTDPYCTADHKKVYVCHNGHTICISVNALQAHLNHGDALGPCPSNARQTYVAAPDPTEGEETEATAANVRPASNSPVKEIFNVTAHPNPSTTDFTLQVNGFTDQPVTVRIMDMNGVVKATYSQILKGNIMKVGAGLPGGTYLAEIRQGNNRQVLKLVKLN